MRIVRLTTEKKLDTIEREMIDALQFFFGSHLEDITLELENRIEKGNSVIYFIRYVYNTKNGKRTGKLPRITLYQPRKGEFVFVLPDEPILAIAIAHGLSDVAMSLDVNIGSYDPLKSNVITTGETITATPITVNIAVNSALTSLILDKKLDARVFPVSLTYGTYVVVYGLKESDDPLESFIVEFEAIYDDDLVEVGIDARSHRKHLKLIKEEEVKFEEEFVHVGEEFIVDTEERLSRRTRR